MKAPARKTIDPFCGEDPDDLLIRVERSMCKESLANFVKLAWHVIEPGSEYTHGWHIDYLAYHLEAISFGETLDDGSPYNRLAIAISPGTMKSLLTNVFFPAWEWGPRNMPHLRYICASHSQELAIRDSQRMRRLVESDWYKERWPHVVIQKDQNQKQKFENTAMGFRQAVAASGITGSRGDRIIIDDALSVSDAMSQQIMETTTTWFCEAVPSRLVSPKDSAIICIQQRLAETDIIGTILDRGLPFDVITLPMRYDPSRAQPSMLGLEDPRTVEGGLLFPERFPADVVERDEQILGKWAFSSQYQQLPVPRGGGIIPVDHWQLWQSENYPPLDYIIASVDGAYTTKQENDCSAMTVWGIFSGGDQKAIPTRTINHKGEIIWDLERQYSQEHPKALLMFAWAERLEFHELIEKVKETMERYQVDKLLIENKANGYSIAQEVRRLYGHEDFGVQLVDPRGQDKLARLYAIQHLFADGLIYAPNKSWADLVINQTATFPKGKADDLVDTTSMALRYLREAGLLKRSIEFTQELDDSRQHTGAAPQPLYPV